LDDLPQGFLRRKGSIMNMLILEHASLILKYCSIQRGAKYIRKRNKFIIEAMNKTRGAPVLDDSECK
jgi:hypothetical protein